MGSIIRRPRARQDLFDIYVYLFRHAGEPVAERFLVAAEASFKELLLYPLIGAPIQFRRLELRGIRKWRIQDFDHYLVFYLPSDRGISIVRVLHESRQWRRLLG